MLWYSCILGYFFNLKGFTNFFWRFFAFSWLAILGVIFFKCSAHISIYLEIIIISKWSFIELDKVQNPKKVKKSPKSKKVQISMPKKDPNLDFWLFLEFGLLTFFWLYTFFLKLDFSFTLLNSDQFSSEYIYISSLWYEKEGQQKQILSKRAIE